jgi:hypothetical protein
MHRRALAVFAVLLAGCSTTVRPVPYQNAKYLEVGRAGFDRDLAECKSIAAQAGATPGAGQAGQVAKGAGAGAVTGAAAGAVGGAIWGNPGIGAASGAVSGVVGALLWPVLGGSSRQPSAAHVNYVNQCLVDRGYQITGWQ